MAETEKIKLLEGIPLNVDRIKADVRREVMRLKKELSRQSDFNNIIQESIRLRKDFQKKLQEDLSRFIMLNDSTKSHLEATVTSVIDECMVEDLLTQDLLDKYLYGFENGYNIEINNILKAAFEAKRKECAIVPKHAKVSELLSMQYDHVKVFMVTE